MYPILFSLGDVAFPAWHVFYALGAMAAYLLLSRLNSRSRICPPHAINQLFLVCYISGYLGARAFAILVEERLPLLDMIPALLSFGPMTFYGGALMAAAAGMIYCAINRLKTLAIADMAIPSALLVLCFGRIGCFLNGDDYGKVAPVGSMIAVTFPNLTDLHPRYPVQLFEAAAALTVVAIALFMRCYSKKPGLVAALTVIAYANTRFYLEFLRDDFRGSLISSYWSPAQEISLALILLATALAIAVIRNSPADDDRMRL